MPAAAAAPTKKAKATTIAVDCSKPVEDGIMDIASFETFLRDNIKIGGKKGVLGDAIKVSREKSKISLTIQSGTILPKRGVKYLTKKYLKKHAVRDYLRVVSAPNGYQLKYFSIAEQDASDEEA